MFLKTTTNEKQISCRPTADRQLGLGPTVLDIVSMD